MHLLIYYQCCQLGKTWKVRLYECNFSKKIEMEFPDNHTGHTGCGVSDRNLQKGVNSAAEKVQGY